MLHGFHYLQKMWVEYEENDIYIYICVCVCVYLTNQILWHARKIGRGHILSMKICTHEDVSELHIACGK